MISCFVFNWGLTITLTLLFTYSEWLSKTDRFKENGVLEQVTNILRMLLRKGS
jgi:hypothetical protein